MALPLQVRAIDPGEVERGDQRHRRAVLARRRVSEREGACEHGATGDAQVPAVVPVRQQRRVLVDLHLQTQVAKPTDEPVAGVVTGRRAAQAWSEGDQRTHRREQGLRAHVRQQARLGGVRRRRQNWRGGPRFCRRRNATESEPDHGDDQAGPQATRVSREGPARNTRHDTIVNEFERAPAPGIDSVTRRLTDQAALTPRRPARRPVADHRSCGCGSSPRTTQGRNPTSG